MTEVTKESASDVCYEAESSEDEDYCSSENIEIVKQMIKQGKGITDSEFHTEAMNYLFVRIFGPSNFRTKVKSFFIGKLLRSEDLNVKWLEYFIEIKNDFVKEYNLFLPKHAPYTPDELLWRKKHSIASRKIGRRINYVLHLMCQQVIRIWNSLMSLTLLPIVEEDIMSMSVNSTETICGDKISQLYLQLAVQKTDAIEMNVLKYAMTTRTTSDSNPPCPVAARAAYLKSLTEQESAEEKTVSQFVSERSTRSQKIGSVVDETCSAVLNGEHLVMSAGSSDVSCNETHLNQPKLVPQKRNKGKKKRTASRAKSGCKRLEALPSTVVDSEDNSSDVSGDDEEDEPADSEEKLERIRVMTSAAAVGIEAMDDLYLDEKFMHQNYALNSAPMNSDDKEACLNINLHCTFRVLDAVFSMASYVSYIQDACDEGADFLQSLEGVWFILRNDPSKSNDARNNFRKAANLCLISRPRLHNIMKNLLYLVKAEIPMLRDVFACAGDGNSDSVTILLALAGCLPQELHYDYDYLKYIPREDLSGEDLGWKKGDFAKYHGTSFFFSWSFHTQHIDLEDFNNKTRKRVQLDILGMSILIIHGRLKHAGSGNVSDKTIRKFFLYLDPCKGCRNTHTYKNADGSLTKENGIYRDGKHRRWMREAE